MDRLIRKSSFASQIRIYHLTYLSSAILNKHTISSRVELNMEILYLPGTFCTRHDPGPFASFRLLQSIWHCVVLPARSRPSSSISSPRFFEVEVVEVVIPVVCNTLLSVASQFERLMKDASGLKARRGRVTAQDPYSFMSKPE